MTHRATMCAAGVVACAAALTMTSPGGAGSLDPPTGPIAPTDRVTLSTPLIGNLPYTISEPGSYVLTSDLRDCLECSDLPSNGLIIDADHVTVDLNGFSIYGDPFSSLDGIVVASGHTNIVIRNGFVRDWQGDGIDLQQATNSRVEHVTVSDCDEEGIHVGLACTVRDCAVSNCGGNGIEAQSGCLIRSCTSIGAGLDGILAVPLATSNGTVIRDCVVRFAGGDGIDAADGCVVRGCAVSFSDAHGILGAPGCTITDNACTLNAGDGIGAVNSLVRGNTCLNNTGTGIVAPGSTVLENHAP
jgi:hypothetical protein